jgi:hypothetical protein
MVITKKKLDQWLAEHSTTVSDEVYNFLIETYGAEPDDGREWSEQDIYEQMRKIILKSKN